VREFTFLQLKNLTRPVTESIAFCQIYVGTGTNNCSQNVLFLGMFTEQVQKAATSYIMPVCSHV